LADIIQTIKFMVFRSFLWTSSVLPLTFLHALAGGLAQLMMTFPNRSRDTTRRNLKVCFPLYNEAETAQLVRLSLQSTIATVLEMGKAWLLPIKDTLALVTDSEGVDALNEAYLSDNGVILFAPHIGNWEIFGFYVSKTLSSSFLFQPPKNKKINDMILKARSRGGVELLPANRRGVSKLVAAFKRGNLVAMLPDQVPTDEGGVFVNFFEKPALTMTLASKLAAKRPCRVFYGFAKRNARSEGFKVIVKEIDVSFFSDNIFESVQAVNTAVEDCIHEAPEQYQWEYKRFKKQPDGSEFY
tara:strand:- start:355 stop:1251 length:897 start_codon:yes stop_codon:yes gene_type:complete